MNKGHQESVQGQRGSLCLCSHQPPPPPGTPRCGFSDPEQRVVSLNIARPLMLGTSACAVASRNTISPLFSLETLSHPSSLSSNATSESVRTPPGHPGDFLLRRVGEIGEIGMHHPRGRGIVLELPVQEPAYPPAWGHHDDHGQVSFQLWLSRVLGTQ